MDSGCGQAITQGPQRYTQNTVGLRYTDRNLELLIITTSLFCLPSQWRSNRKRIWWLRTRNMRQVVGNPEDERYILVAVVVVVVVVILLTFLCLIVFHFRTLLWMTWGMNCPNICPDIIWFTLVFKWKMHGGNGSVMLSWCDLVSASFVSCWSEALATILTAYKSPFHT